MKSVWLAVRRTFAIALIVSIGPTAPLLAQVSAVSQGHDAAPMALHITILDGEDALNSIRERTAREPVVQVEDENHKPVAGALLLFTIQGGPDGAGASFNGLTTLSVTTDTEGKATAHGLRPNQIQGKYSIGVQATLGSLVATAVIAQSNVVSAGSGSGSTTSTQPGAPGTEAPAGPTGLPNAPTGTPNAPGSAVPSPGATPAPAGTSPVAAETPMSPAGGSIGRSATGHATRRALKLTHLLKKPWVVASGVVIVGVVVGVVVATNSGNGPTTISTGTGTVTAP